MVIFVNLGGGFEWVYKDVWVYLLAFGHLHYVIAEWLSYVDDRVSSVFLVLAYFSVVFHRVLGSCWLGSKTTEKSMSP